MQLATTRYGKVCLKLHREKFARSQADSKGGYDSIIVNESFLLGLLNTRAALQALQLKGSAASLLRTTFVAS